MKGLLILKDLVFYFTIVTWEQSLIHYAKDNDTDIIMSIVSVTLTIIIACFAFLSMMTTSEIHRNES